MKKSKKIQIQNLPLPMTTRSPGNNESIKNAVVVAVRCPFPMEMLPGNSNFERCRMLHSTNVSSNCGPNAVKLKNLTLNEKSKKVDLIIVL